MIAKLHVDEVNEDADMGLDANWITSKNRPLRAGLYPAYFEVVGLSLRTSGTGMYVSLLLGQQTLGSSQIERENFEAVDSASTSH